MSTVRDAGRASPSGTPRYMTWAIGSAAVGFLVTYNSMRLAGASPPEASWPAMIVGLLVGIAGLGLALVVGRYARAGGQGARAAPAKPPAPAGLSAPQRDALRATALSLGGLAVVGLAVGVFLGLAWLADDPGERELTALILAVWNILAGLWLGDEAMRARRGEADGTEAAVLGCLLTAVLASVGLSRGLAEPGQVLLIVLAGVAGAAAGVAVWRLAGSRGLPVGALAAVVVAGLALAIPLL